MLLFSLTVVLGLEVIPKPFWTSFPLQDCYVSTVIRVYSHGKQNDAQVKEALATRLQDYASRVKYATNSYAHAREELQKACLGGCNH